MASTWVPLKQAISGGGFYFGVGLWANSTPLRILSLRPVLQVSKSCFSFVLISRRGLVAFSAPDGCKLVNNPLKKWWDGAMADIPLARPALKNNLLRFLWQYLYHPELLGDRYRLVRQSLSHPYWPWWVSLQIYIRHWAREYN